MIKQTVFWLIKSVKENKKLEGKGCVCVADNNLFVGQTRIETEQRKEKTKKKGALALHKLIFKGDKRKVGNVWVIFRIAAFD